MEIKHISTGYKPIFWQANTHGELKRFNVLVIHRRGTKTVFSINEMIDQGLRCNLKNPKYAYIAPTYKQASIIAWDYLLEYTKNLPGVEVHKKDLAVTVKRPPPWDDKIEYRLLGSDNPDSLRGIYLDGAVIDEFAQCDPIIWGEILRPALSDRKGWCIFIGTPKGKNHFYERYNKAVSNPSWYTKILPADESGIIPKAELEEMRLDMTEDEFEQEMLCFKENTLIATPNGHIKIQNINVGDYVYTHKGRVNRVCTSNSKKYAGKWVKITRSGSTEPLECTPNHPFLTYENGVTSWKNAEDLTCEDYLVSPRKAQQSELNIINQHFVKLLAWYIGEGHISKNVIVLSLNYKDFEVLKQVQYICDSLKLKYKIVKARTANCVIIFNTKLSDILINSCGKRAENKKIPFNLIAGNEYIFLKELMKSDGCLIGDECYTYGTISRILALDVQVLCSFLGFKSRTHLSKRAKTTIIEGRTVNQRDAYYTTIYLKHKNTKQGPIQLTRHYTLYKIRKVEIEENECDIYNIEVENDHSYLAEGVAVHNCNFASAAPGVYFGKIMAQLRRDGRIRSVPYDPSVPVDTFWDLGIGDSTAIWFRQRVGINWHYIDYYEKSGEGLEHFVKELRDRPYAYGRHVVPHDAAARDLSTGMTRQEFLRKLGLRVEIQKRQAVDDRIQATRVILPKSYFDEVKCQRGISALEDYQKEWDSKLMMYKNKPFHNWTSHAADSFGYSALDVRDSEFEGGEYGKKLPEMANNSYDEFGGVG
jgi:hypothetical protein